MPAPPRPEFVTGLEAKLSNGGGAYPTGTIGNSVFKGAEVQVER